MAEAYGCYHQDDKQTEEGRPKNLRDVEEEIYECFENSARPAFEAVFDTIEKQMKEVAGEEKKDGKEK